MERFEELQALWQRQQPAPSAERLGPLMQKIRAHSSREIRMIGVKSGLLVMPMGVLVLVLLRDLLRPGPSPGSL